MQCRYKAKTMPIPGTAYYASFSVKVVPGIVLDVNLSIQILLIILV